jgi:hypothetical protein
LETRETSIKEKNGKEREKQKTLCKKGETRKESKDIEKGRKKNKTKGRRKKPKRTRKITAYMGVLLKHFFFAELITKSYNMRHQVGGRGTLR